MPPSGGAVAINLSAGVGCVWGSVMGLPGWISERSHDPIVGNGSIVFDVQLNTLTARSAALDLAGQKLLIMQEGAPPASSLRFVPITPCRIADTRDVTKTGAFGPPGLQANSTRDLPIPQSSCNVPSAARAYSLNITAVPSGPLAYLTAYPSGNCAPIPPR